jgi:hypothetical protein
MDAIELRGLFVAGLVVLGSVALLAGAALEHLFERRRGARARHGAHPGARIPAPHADRRAA